MRPIKLPEPPTSPRGMPEIFDGGIYGVIKRAIIIIIGNGFPGAENQCIGLVRALGLSDKQLFYLSESWSYPPLNDTAEAVSKIHQALAV